MRKGQAGRRQRPDRGVLSCAGKARNLKKGNPTHPDHANLAQVLTKDFLEQKMQDYTQKVRPFRLRAPPSTVLPGSTPQLPVRVVSKEQPEVAQALCLIVIVHGRRCATA